MGHRRTAPGAWTATTDDADTKESKIGYKAGLFLMVNPSLPIRSAYVPDGTIAYVLPCSYRAFLNTINTSTGVHPVTEVVLPGQPSYNYDAGPDGTAGTDDDIMYRNYLPNRYTTNTAVASNQVLRVPQQGFNTASGYLTANASVVNDTDITVNTGTGPILAGESVTIGTYKYLVVSPLTSAGVFKIAAPGIRVATSANTAVTVNAPAVGAGTGYIRSIMPTIPRSAPMPRQSTTSPSTPAPAAFCPGTRSRSRERPPRNILSPAPPWQPRTLPSISPHRVSVRRSMTTRPSPSMPPVAPLAPDRTILRLPRLRPAPVP